MRDRTFAMKASSPARSGRAALMDAMAASRGLIAFSSSSTSSSASARLTSMSAAGAVALGAVSYTHLTLPTKRIV